MKILFWLLPIADLFYLDRILDFYRGWGVDIPPAHARLGLLERWVGYLPVGAIAGKYLGVRSLMLFLGVFPLAGALELYLMWKGVKPWGFFRGKPRKSVTKIFLLEAYNCFNYFALGVLIGVIL